MMSLGKRESVGTCYLAVTRGAVAQERGPGNLSLAPKLPIVCVQVCAQERQSIYGLRGLSRMEKDNPPHLVTPMSVKAIISKIEAAQLIRTQEVTPEMKKTAFCSGLMWRLGPELTFTQDSSLCAFGGSWDT